METAHGAVKADRENDVKMTGNAEAHLIRRACSEPSEGYARRTLHLSADELVTPDEIDFESISHETVRQRLKNTLKPHRSDYWSIPPKKTPTSSPTWRTFSISITNPTTRTSSHLLR